MRKGNQVKIVGRHPYCGREGIVKYSWPRIYRHTTHTEREAWYDSPASKGMNCAGETKLPPLVACVKYEGGTIHRPNLTVTRDEIIKLSDDTFVVVKARCAPNIGYSKMPKAALIRNERTGEEAYIRRAHLKVW